MRRTIVGLLALTAIVVTPGAALADPAGPTNYRSEVTGVEPDGARVDVDVFGGDAFLTLTVEPGVEVYVPGYETEEGASPYLWFAPDGNVLVNERSPATYLNDARYGSRDVAVPELADAMKPPVWTVVGEGGTYSWHDHRIHWMSPSLPDQVDADAGTDQSVFDWEVPLLVDGEEVVVRGQLTWVPSRTPVVPAVLAVVLALGGALVVRREPASSLPIVVGVAAVAALGATAAQNVGIPAGAAGPFQPLLLAGVGLLGALVSLARRRRDATQAKVVALLATLPVGAAVLVQARGLVAPEIASALPPVVVGALLAAALGLAAGSLLGGLTTLVTPLEPDPAPVA